MCSASRNRPKEAAAFKVPVAFNGNALFFLLFIDVDEPTHTVLISVLLNFAL